MQRVFLYGLVFGLLAAAPPLAQSCEPALLRLILKRDSKGAWEAKAKTLSGLLLDIGRAARQKQHQLVQERGNHYVETWGETYAQLYASPPPGFRDDPHWRTRFDSITQASLPLANLEASANLEDLHPILEGIQTRLTEFFLPKPGSGGVKTQFETLQAVAIGLDQAFQAQNANWPALKERLAGFRKRAQATEPPAEAWKSFETKLQGMEAQLPQTLPAPDFFTKSLEALRTATLARLWFSGGSR